MIDNPPSCLKTKDHMACQDAVYSIIFFTTAFGVTILGEKSSELRSKSNEDVIHILCSRVYSESRPILRMTAPSSLDIPGRQLSLPPRTQVLRDFGTEEIIGWFIKDQNVPSGQHETILCVNIARWRASGTLASFIDWAPVDGYAYKNEDNMDFIALEAIGPAPGLYQ